MTHRITQRIVADPRRGDGANAAGIPGDCLRACIATALGLPYERVPHVALHGRAWWEHLRRWLRAEHGVDIGCVLPEPLDGDADAVLLRGPSPRGPFAHVVVGRLIAGQLFARWDPHPSRAGLAGGRVDEVYVFTRPYWPPPEQRALTARPAD